MEAMQERLKPHLNIILINTRHNLPSKLNYECGIDFVQRNRLEPMGYSAGMPSKVVCLDSVASRLMYLKRGNQQVPTLIDADK